MLKALLIWKFSTKFPVLLLNTPSFVLCLQYDFILINVLTCSLILLWLFVEMLPKPNIENLSLLIVLLGRNQLFPTYNTPELYCICILFICTHNPPGKHVHIRTYTLIIQIFVQYRFQAKSVRLSDVYHVGKFHQLTICHVEKLFHVAICHREKNSTWQICSPLACGTCDKYEVWF